MTALSAKVCHFTSVHHPDDIRIFVKECRSLAKFGYDVTLVATNCDTYEKDGVKVLGVQSRSKNRFSRMLKTAYRTYRAAKKLDADIYHFHDPELLPYGYLLKRRGKIVVYDSHEDVPKQIMGKYWINPHLRKIISNAFRRYENFITRRLSAVVTATPNICRRFEQVNPSSVDINNFPLLHELELPAGTTGTKDCAVCYVGGITELRGIAEMVDALAIADGPRMHLAGVFSPESLYADTQKRAGWNKVDYYGSVNRQKVSEILSRSLAGMVTLHEAPNYVDSQPIKMFEYMSAGIPVIASDFPLWRQVLEGNRCGICVNPLDPADIARGIRHIVEHPEEAAEMGANGRKAVETRYNWEVEETKLDTLYRSLLQTK